MNNATESEHKTLTLRMEGVTPQQAFIQQLRAVNGLGIMGFIVLTINRPPALAESYVTVIITFSKATEHEKTDLRKQFQAGEAHPGSTAEPKTVEDNQESIGSREDISNNGGDKDNSAKSPRHIPGSSYEEHAGRNPSGIFGPDGKPLGG